MDRGDLNRSIKDFYIGNIRAGEKDFEGALESFSRAIAKNPRHVLAKNNRGIIRR